MAGQVKSVKPCLKQLQQSIQSIMMPSWNPEEGRFCVFPQMVLFLLFLLFLLTVHFFFISVTSTNVGDMFIWMPKEHLYVLVYLVTVMHSMQAGHMDKAQKYTEKALMQIEKLKSEYTHKINSSLKH